MKVRLPTGQTTDLHPLFICPDCGMEHGEMTDHARAERLCTECLWGRHKQADQPAVRDSNKVHFPANAPHVSGAFDLSPKDENYGKRQPQQGQVPPQGDDHKNAPEGGEKVEEVEDGEPQPEPDPN